MNKIGVSIVATNEPVNEIRDEYYLMKKWLQKEEHSNTCKRQEILELYQQ